MAKPRVLMGLFVPVATQVINSTNSTSVAVNSTIRTGLASRLVISVETNNARYRDDGTNPTVNTGILFTVANSPYVINGYNRTSNFKFIRQTGASKITIIGYKNQGDS